MLVTEALEEYLVQLEADGRSRHTRDQYRRHVRLLVGWLEEEGHTLDVDGVGHRDLARFLVSDTVQCRADGAPRKATSANALRSSLRTFFAFLDAAGYVQANAARLVRRARCSPGPPRALTTAEQGRLLAVLDEAETDAEKRDRALFRTMLGTGARLGEVLGARVEDLDLDEATLRIRHEKGGGEGMLYLPGEVVEVLEEYLDGRDEGWLFPGRSCRALGSRQAHRRLEGWLKKAKIRRAASPHSLRHTFALSLYERTGDLLVTQAALRHRSISSTTIYAQCDGRRLREAFL